MTVARRDAKRRPLSSIVLAALCLAAAGPGLSQKVRSAEPTPGEPSLRVVVDPRVELMSVIFRLAGNPEYGKGRVSSYVDDVEKQFGPFRDHDVVKLARRLRSTRGVSYDAVMKMAVHLSDTVKLGEKVPFKPQPKTLDSRWRIAEARDFLEAARRFVVDASFDDFVEEHRPLYDLTESRMQAVLQEHGHLEWFDEFFGARPEASFTVALGLLNGGNCYGARCPTAEGGEELFCVLGVWATDDEGKPRFDQAMLETVTHEFCHSYTNAIVDRHEAEFEPAAKKIFPHVQEAMSRQAYGNWKTVIYESLVRACCVRYTGKYSGARAAQAAIQYNKQRQFVWIEELSDLLGEYETNRERYPTLDAFSPRIVAFFDGYAETFAAEQVSLDAKRPKVVSITPAAGSGDVDPGLTTIKVVFDRAMRDGSWSMVGGGPSFPELKGNSGYDATRTVWTVPVELKPAWTYRFMLNHGRFQGFRSQDGTPLAPVTVTFTTRKE